MDDDCETNDDCAFLLREGLKMRGCRMLASILFRFKME